MRKQLFLLPVLLVLMSSCVTQRKPIVNYLEDVRDSSVNKNVIIAEPVIQKNDLLSIQVSSIALDQKVDVDYNLPVLPGASAQPGYLVDFNGNIEIPRLGVFKAQGLTKSELQENIKAKLKGLVNQPTVLIRFLNFRVTVLGEVAAAGVITTPAENMTILEAVGMAGGVTQFGSLKNVRVLREANGVRETGTLDLSSQSIFNSKYYRLQQNDVVLVDQNTVRVDEEARQRNFQRLTLAVTVISTLALLYNLFK